MITNQYSIDDVIKFLRKNYTGPYDIPEDVKLIISDWVENNAHIAQCEIIGYGVCTCGYWIGKLAFL